ncbi:hypothetical protein EYF80_039819 [Liparis tanakae]|uniref:Uncharacterized protein n=1 Tax=Liparis tanakae TaxID=230148 RepID=A0A4Z2G9W1_9TELE|nr:hypothetical protein EYF80_039819 [Liparis tanakae]
MSANGGSACKNISLTLYPDLRAAAVSAGQQGKLFSLVHGVVCAGNDNLIPGLPGLLHFVLQVQHHLAVTEKPTPSTVVKFCRASARPPVSWFSCSLTSSEHDALPPPTTETSAHASLDGGTEERERERRGSSDGTGTSFTALSEEKGSVLEAFDGRVSDGQRDDAAGRQRAQQPGEPPAVVARLVRVVALGEQHLRRVLVHDAQVDASAEVALEGVVARGQAGRRDVSGEQRPGDSLGAVELQSPARRDSDELAAHAGHPRVRLVVRAAHQGDGGARAVATFGGADVKRSPVFYQDVKGGSPRRRGAVRLHGRRRRSFGGRRRADWSHPPGDVTRRPLVAAVARSHENREAARAIARRHGTELLNNTKQMLWGTLGVGETVADSSACTLEDDTGRATNSRPRVPQNNSTDSEVTTLSGMEFDPEVTPSTPIKKLQRWRYWLEEPRHRAVCPRRVATEKDT